MGAKSLSFYLLRALYKGGAWLFDRSGPLAPALAQASDVAHSRLFPRSFVMKVPNPVELGGLRVYHDGRPSYHLQMLAMGTHDRDVVSLLEAFVKPGMTVLDVGAHFGYFSLLSARLVGPRGSVWAFEPVPHAIQLLVRNIEVNNFAGRIHVVPQAVSDAPGTATIHSNPAESMTSTLYPGTVALSTAANRPGKAASNSPRFRPIEVACTSLDDWSARQNWPPVDMVKMDIEGAETAALRGMVQTSRRNPRLKLIVEFNPKTLSAAGVSIGEFWGALEACGFGRISMAGPPLRLVDFPADLPLIMQEIRRLGNDRVNLLCEKGAA
ncbi:MAG: FkbM family methyltransferase [Chloroflexota bacterium]|nr:FkbM family methyltransferase [Chloroflexota bacterium]